MYIDEMQQLFSCLLRWILEDMLADMLLLISDEENMHESKRKRPN